MKKSLLILIFFIFIVVVSIIILRLYTSGDTSGGTSGYRKIFDVSTVEQLKEHFLWDNPNENGSDPTGGMVDYTYGMERGSDGKIVPNINGDMSWAEIRDNSTSKELITDVAGGGVKINLSNKLDKIGNVGAPRLISRKFFRGGLFIFDVEHAPLGCAVWPALWMNGFIGTNDQYHQNEKHRDYNSNMEKLARTTLGTSSGTKEGYYNHSCSSKEDSINGRIDPHLSKFVGKDVYPMEWPGGGELDILEQTNFSPTNLVSIHGGPNCQVTSALESTNFAGGNVYGPDSKLRSVCGGKGCKSDNIDDGSNPLKRPSCPSAAVESAGNSQIVVPGGFGEDFNKNKGGVYVVQWVPKETIKVWFYPNNLFSKDYLGQSKGPLSSNPDPSTWSVEDKTYRTLVASYILNDKDAINDACDINFQSIIINITMGGGWAGAVMPEYCNVQAKSQWNDYISKCYNADPDAANNNEDGAYDPSTGCYDGARSYDLRGIDSKAVFYSEAYFNIRKMKVFQNKKTDQDVW
jgi:hypothetical protein